MRSVAGRSAALLAAAALVLTGCGQGGPGGGEGKVSGGKVVLGVLNDQSGVYADVSGPNSVEAVKMAVADFKRAHPDSVIPEIEVVVADHQNKPDVANAKAAELYDRRRADVILDVPTSSAALAVANVANQKKRIHLNVSAATTELTGKSCNKYTFQYGFDTHMLAFGTGKTLTRQGAKNWYIVYPDYAYGQDMDRSFTAAIAQAGGKVVRSDPAPFPNDNFSTFLLKAPKLKPKPDVIGTMQAGGDLVNLVKQYNEFKLADQGVGLAVGLMFITDIHSLGVEAFSGVTFTDAWYWNFDEKNREWADRFKAKTGTRPSFLHAGNYSAALQYLEAVQRAGSDDSEVVADELRGHEFNDVFARNGKIRAEDNLLVHDVYLAKVQDSSEVTEEWDYEEIIATIPGEEAFGKVEDTECRMR